MDECQFNSFQEYVPVLYSIINSTNMERVSNELYVTNITNIERVSSELYITNVKNMKKVSNDYSNYMYYSPIELKL